ncbi:MAG: AraC family transcriptional regulator [Mesorhizobium sp.]|nr:MAG: AraC family transcriptional regulator [Mesorhizobium sp.]
MMYRLGETARYFEHELRQPLVSAPPAPASLLATDQEASSLASHFAHIRASRSVGGHVGDSAVRIKLPFMDVVLSLSACASNGTMDVQEFAMPATSDAISADPVLQQLVEQFHRSDSDDEDGLYSDAIRLALAARWLRLRSNGQNQPVDGLQQWRLKRVTAYIDKHINEAISLADLAQTAGLSRMYFAARFRAATGLRPHDYILRRRIERAKELLLQNEQSLVDVALDVGFQTQAHFTTVFKRLEGTTPGRWRVANYQPVQ